MSDADLTDDAAALQDFARELSRIQRQAGTDDVRWEVTQSGAEITLRYPDAIRTPDVDLTEPETMTDGNGRTRAEVVESIRNKLDEMRRDGDPITDGGQEPVKNREWIAEQLDAVSIVEWDRFVTEDHDGDQLVRVYGWIDRDDEYKDFVLARFWPDHESFGYTTSSDEWTEYLAAEWFGDSETHTACRRVEDAFDVENAVELHEQETLADGGWLVDSSDTTPKLDPTGRTHWSDLQGVQRDALALLFGDDPMVAATVHGRLEESYGRPLDDGAVEDALDHLTREGLVVRERGAVIGERVDPRPSQFALTSEGRYVVRSHGQWLHSQIEGRRPGGER